MYSLSEFIRLRTKILLIHHRNHTMYKQSVGQFFSVETFRSVTVEWERGGREREREGSKKYLQAAILTKVLLKICGSY